jgi:tetratricopeptide (TPR) repeat protein
VAPSEDPPNKTDFVPLSEEPTVANTVPQAKVTQPSAPPSAQPPGSLDSSDLFASLQDDLSLPDFAPSKTARNLTLIGGELPEAHAKPPRHTLMWSLLAVTVAAVVAAGVWRKTLVALVLPAPPAPVQPVSAPPAVEAQAALAAGVQAYTQGSYVAAITQFEGALRLDPTLAEAHRSLGIVYATQHDQAKAVQHYRLYLLGRPKAVDAQAVQKIVHDYELTQHDVAKAVPKPVPKAKPPVPAHAKKSLRPGKKLSAKAPLKKIPQLRRTPQH